MNRPAAGPAELQELRGFLRGIKGRLTFQALAGRAAAAGWPVDERTLRRALDGRLPSRRTTIAFARGAAGQGGQAARIARTAEQLWEKAAAACRPPAPEAAGRAPYVPGPITTRAGLVRAMRRLRAAAGHLSLRAICEAAGGRIARSTLQLVLAGRRLPGAELLAAFADVCNAGPAATAALLAARDRILNGPPPRPLSVCEFVEKAESRRVSDAAARPWLPDPDLKPDWYDQQLRDDKDAARAAMTSWAGALSDAELEALEQPAGPDGREGRGLLAEVAARAARIRPAP